MQMNDQVLNFERGGGGGELKCFKINQNKATAFLWSLKPISSEIFMI